MDRTTTLLVDYALEFRTRTFDASEYWNLNARMIDTIGCAMGALDAAPVRIACRLSLPVIAGVPSARIFGLLTRTTCDLAAFANGFMVRYLDFNDAYRNVDGCHPSDYIPGLIAVAESRRLGGEKLLRSIALAYEVQVSFADTIALDVLGWDHTIPGALSCALGASALLDLSPAQMAHAISLSVCPNMATHQRHRGELSMWKSGAAAIAARHGVFAAMLAAEGITGPTDPFEGEAGLWAQTSGSAVKLSNLAAKSECLGVTRTGIKRWPVRDSCQLPINCALQLRRQITEPDQIESVCVQTYQSAFRGRDLEPELWCPTTRETADHSIPFLVAVALVDGTVSIDTFEQERFLSPDIRALMARITVETSPAFSAKAPALRNCRIEGKLNGGEAVAEHLEVPGSVILRPEVATPAIEDKFNRLTERHLAPAQRTRLLETLWRLQTIDDVSTVVDLTYSEHVLRERPWQVVGAH